MKTTDLARHTTGIDAAYELVGEVTANVSRGSVLSKSPTIEDVHFKLQEEASKLGANAVIYVTDKRGMSVMS